MNVTTGGPQSLSVKDIAWLAGLVEGEGCFTVDAKRPAYPRFRLGMTDFDVVRSAAFLLKSSIQNEPPSGLGSKRIYILRLCGKRAAGLMMTLYPLLGARRKKRIRGILRDWKNTPILGLPPNCHPERKHCARGLCNMCWQRSRRRPR